MDLEAELAKAKGERAVLAQLLKEADGVLATVSDDTNDGDEMLNRLRQDIAKALGAPADATQQGIPA
jgi:chlorite dismutase